MVEHLISYLHLMINIVSQIQGRFDLFLLF